MLAIIALAREGTPLWKQILTGIPHDPAAFVAYALVAVFGGLVWHGNRKKSDH